MTAQQRLRMSIDISMTVLSIILMGGNYFFPWNGVHEILGVVLLILWTVHIILNHHWYAAMFRGRYPVRRIVQTVVNVGILICAVMLMISGIMLSQQVFAFLHIGFGADFARKTHMLASHWYFILMSLHIGMHLGQMTARIKAKRHKPLSRPAKIIIIIVFAAVYIYGIYAFIYRGLWRYLILLQQFFYLDLERGYIVFFTDYLAMIIAIAMTVWGVERRNNS